MRDMINQAVKLALNHSTNYNPGLPLTIDFRPLTVSPIYGGRDKDTPPGTNIFRSPCRVRTNGSLSANSIDANVKLRILRGDKGCSSDFTGLLILTFYSEDPDKWHALFHRHDMQIHYTELLYHITGLPSKHTSAFVNSSDSLFGGETDPDHPLTQEKVLRSLLHY